MDPCAVQAEIVAWLERPENHSHRPARVEHLETHVSHVFLAGDLVYKLKKPVVFDFLDFSTADAREQACREELRLNRRLAPEVYLDVAPITRDSQSRLQLGGDGRAVDWLVVMRRLPTDETLDSLHRAGRLTPQHIQRLVGTLSRFYAGLPAERISSAGYRQRITAHVQDNWREMAASASGLPARLVSRVHGFQLRLLMVSPELFDARVQQGRIVEGHGDLRPEHICFTSPMAIFDCIEFRREFRILDVADELAFLAAECDFLGADWVAPQLLEDWQAQTKDAIPAALWSFYRSYRACVRAKVADLRASQLPDAAREAATSDAMRHLELADRYAAPFLRPVVILIGGLSGTGKSTLARSLAELLGAEVLRTDVIRRQVFGQDHGATPGFDLYSNAARQKVYDELFLRASELANDGRNVILDGVFAGNAPLRRAMALATTGSFLAVECVCRPETALARIAGRLASGHDASEATPAVHEQQRRDWRNWPGDVPQVRIDTEMTPDRQLALTISALRSACGGGSVDPVDLASQFDD